MKRGYTAEGFRRITDSIRERLGSDIHLSTDLMVGFPGEDEKAFENSIGFVKEIGFGKMHVFNYSPREGTAAALMQCPSEKDVRERMKTALCTAETLHRDYCSRWIGKEIEILVEEKKEGTVRGLTRNYIKAAAFSDKAETGEEFRFIPERYVNGVLVSGPVDDGCGEYSDFPEFL